MEKEKEEKEKEEVVRVTREILYHSNVISVLVCFFSHLFPSQK